MKWWRAFSEGLRPCRTAYGISSATLHFLGFGILMTRNLVDELVYSQRGNEVLFVKCL